MTETRMHGRTSILRIVVPAVVVTLCFAALSCVAFSIVADAEVSDSINPQNSLDSEGSENQLLTDTYPFDFNDHPGFKASPFSYKPYRAGGQDHDHSVLGVHDPHDNGPMF